LRIREGDPLEIFTDREGEIILKKYVPEGQSVATKVFMVVSSKGSGDDYSENIEMVSFNEKKVKEFRDKYNEVLKIEGAKRWEEWDAIIREFEVQE